MGLVFPRSRTTLEVMEINSSRNTVSQTFSLTGTITDGIRVLTEYHGKRGDLRIEVNPKGMPGVTWLRRQFETRSTVDGTLSVIESITNVFIYPPSK